MLRCTRSIRFRIHAGQSSASGTHAPQSFTQPAGWQRCTATYGYAPVVYTTCPPGTELTNGIVFCRIRSWLTGRRLVSLPFADHCEPLVDNPGQWEEVLAFLQRSLKEEKLKYIEIRPLTANTPADLPLQKGNSFCFHTLDLRPSLDDLFQRTDRKSAQKRVRRAEREPISYEEGCSEALLKKFYGLWILTRKRHNLPPQPIQWFRNLITQLSGQLLIRVVSYRQGPIGSILTLSHRDTYVYKYGCSDARYHNLGIIPFLLWSAIRTAKERGMRVFDFGRSDMTNKGLIRFKDNWGTTRSTLTYGRICAQVRHAKGSEHLVHLTKRIFA